MTSVVDPFLPPASPPRARRGGRLSRRGRGAAPVADVPEHAPALTLVAEVEPRSGSDRSALEVEFDGQVCALLLRIAEQEERAEAAQAGPGQHVAWPSWSMDSGLTVAQETFVEIWSPQRVAEAARSVRHLVLVLQDWTSTHREDTDLDHALTVLATLRSL